MGAWDAQWISYNGEPKDEIGFFAFRRSFELDSVPSEFICRVSADQRYKLFVNGELVSLGPQRGDLQHYFYDTLDLAAHLGPGKNWIAAFVWNFGESAPIAQHTHRLGFVLEGPGVSTGAEWQVARLPGLDFKFMVSGEQPAFYAVGPGEIARFADMAWGWATGTMWPAEWQTPFTVGGAYERGAYPTGDGGWWLVPRSLPPMLYQEFAGEVQEVDPATNARKPLEPKVLTRGESLIVDFGELLCGYMRVRLSAQPGTKVEITYAEAPMDPQTHEKGDRNDLKGKQILGLQDRVVTDGKMRTFEPAWWRTCRYLKVESSGLIELESIGMMETGYPLREQSSFTGDDAAIEPLWDVSVRTARRCAGETYFDCPYYEQLQYAGDTRLQALIGYYLSSDRALQRAAIESFAWSALPEGLTQSRYPSRHAQVIPPFSLWWIMMLYDKWLYDPEPPAEEHLELAQRILAQWRKLLKGDPERAFWNFVDWQPDWPGGVAPGGVRATVNHLLMWLADMAAAKMEGEVEEPVVETVQRIGKKVALGELVTQGADDTPTEHAEAIFRLCQEMAGEPVADWPGEKLAEAGAPACGYYFSYYKHQAKKPDDYLAELGDWKAMLNRGLTTFVEHQEPTRSDCHAWSAHPVLGFFQLISGVTSAAPGWSQVRIEPRPGTLSTFDARIAHPKGELHVGLQKGRVTVDTPVPATVVWNGQEMALPEGLHRID